MFEIGNHTIPSPGDEVPKMIVKVCGMREAQNIRDVEALGVNWMGFIFWPQSKRLCSEVPAYLPVACKRVGVFVNAEVEEIVEKTVAYGLDIIQLHGDESRPYIMQLRQALYAHPALTDGPVRQIVKAMSLKEKSDLQRCEPYVGFVDYFLFDTPSAGYGGTGRQFDWQLLSEYNCMTPFILSGGIGPDSVEALKAFQHPCLAGIDLNSRFEVSPGLKDVPAIASFLDAMVQ